MILEDSYKHKGMRKALAEELRQKGITDKNVLAAIEAVPRHFFFEKAFLNHAYEDKAFPIGEDQTISQPYTVAFQSSLLNIKPGEKVLEIGTGSGYQACVLCELKADLYSVEVIPALHERAKKMLYAMEYKPQLFLADGSLGLESYAPFDKIIVTAGAPKIPDSLINQLKIGGLMIIPVGSGKTQEMIRIKKLSEQLIEKEDLGKFSFVPLIRKTGW